MYGIGVWVKLDFASLDFHRAVCNTRHMMVVGGRVVVISNKGGKV